MPKPSPVTIKKREKVLAWVKDTKSAVTAAWSAYSAAKVGITWDDWLEAREKENVK